MTTQIKTLPSPPEMPSFTEAADIWLRVYKTLFNATLDCQVSRIASEKHCPCCGAEVVDE